MFDINKMFSTRVSAKFFNEIKIRGLIPQIPKDVEEKLKDIIKSQIFKFADRKTRKELPYITVSLKIAEGIIQDFQNAGINIKDIERLKKASSDILIDSFKTFDQILTDIYETLESKGLRYGTPLWKKDFEHIAEREIKKL